MQKINKIYGKVFTDRVWGFLGNIQSENLQSNWPHSLALSSPQQVHFCFLCSPTEARKAFGSSQTLSKSWQYTYISMNDHEQSLGTFDNPYCLPPGSCFRYMISLDFRTFLTEWNHILQFIDAETGLREECLAPVRCWTGTWTLF